MEIQIGEKKYELAFGLGFIRKMDEFHTVKAQGIPLGVGVETAITHLGTRNPVILVDIIKAATDHLKSKPSNSGIDEYIEGQAAEGKLEELFKIITEAMEESVFLKPKMQEFKKGVQRAQREQKQAQ
ncbi:tail assembly chaperone [Oceanobacillus oncorhynchi]|uniref:tail assembly chaperone n=1 Tax=Oceanobacillus oncorhynchi TaxID=545501 RepID=UPI002F964090